MLIGRPPTQPLKWQKFNLASGIVATVGSSLEGSTVLAGPARVDGHAVDGTFRTPDASAGFFRIERIPGVPVGWDE